MLCMCLCRSRKCCRLAQSQEGEETVSGQHRPLTSGLFSYRLLKGGRVCVNYIKSKNTVRMCVKKKKKKRKEKRDW
jgi:hypothetical protein